MGTRMAKELAQEVDTTSGTEHDSFDSYDD